VSSAFTVSLRVRKRWFNPTLLRLARNDPAAETGGAVAAQPRARMELTDEERDLLLAALFELRITHADDDEKAAQIEALVLKLGGDPDAVFFQPE
jgi:hypothetical protein